MRDAENIVCHCENSAAAQFSDSGALNARSVRQTFARLLPSKTSALPSPVELFWIFILCSVIGLLIEEVYYLAFYGEFQNRSGLIFGPFSPIYGVGAICILIVGRSVEKSSLPAQFFVFAVVGGAVEFAVSWLLQTIFGIQAWDYSGTFLSIDGRTNAQFMAMWGTLGILCVKVLLPMLNKHVLPALKRISPNITKIAIALFALDIALTVVSLNCWYHRASGAAPATPVQEICAVAFDDNFMSNHFQTMQIHP